MDNIQFSISYIGDTILVDTKPEENVIAIIYPVFLNDQYSFTTYQDEEDEWKILREPNGTTPMVENELWKMIIKKLTYAIRYAA